MRFESVARVRVMGVDCIHVYLPGIMKTGLANIL